MEKSELRRLCWHVATIVVTLPVCWWLIHSYLESGYRQGVCPAIQVWTRCIENVRRARDQE
jgi:hypothetical protein